MLSILQMNRFGLIIIMTSLVVGTGGVTDQVQVWILHSSTLHYSMHNLIYLVAVSLKLMNMKVKLILFLSSRRLIAVSLSRVYCAWLPTQGKYRRLQLRTGHIMTLLWSTNWVKPSMTKEPVCCGQSIA